MSREVARLAGTNRLPPLIVYDVAIPPPTRFSSSFLPLSASLSPSVYGEFMIYPGQCGGQGYAEHRSILLLLMCQTPHLLYSILACPATPGLTNPPRVAMRTPLHTYIHLSIFTRLLLPPPIL